MSAESPKAEELWQEMQKLTIEDMKKPVFFWNDGQWELWYGKLRVETDGVYLDWDTTEEAHNELVRIATENTEKRRRELVARQESDPQVIKARKEGLLP
jgi:hypothetical protein